MLCFHLCFSYSYFCFHFVFIFWLFHFISVGSKQPKLSTELCEHTHTRILEEYGTLFKAHTDTIAATTTRWRRTRNLKACVRKNEFKLFYNIFMFLLLFDSPPHSSLPLLCRFVPFCFLFPLACIIYARVGDQLQTRAKRFKRSHHLPQMGHKKCRPQ